MLALVAIRAQTLPTVTNAIDAGNALACFFAAISTDVRLDALASRVGAAAVATAFIWARPVGTANTLVAHITVANTMPAFTAAIAVPRAHLLVAAVPRKAWLAQACTIDARTLAMAVCTASYVSAICAHEAILTLTLHTGLLA